MKQICVLLFSLSHLIHIPSFPIANVLCRRRHFGSATLIDAKTKYRSPYLLDVSQSLRRPQDVSEGVLRTLLGHPPWCYRLDHMGTSL